MDEEIEHQKLFETKYFNFLVIFFISNKAQVFIVIFLFHCFDKWFLHTKNCLKCNEKIYFRIDGSNKTNFSSHAKHDENSTKKL